MSRGIDCSKGGTSPPATGNARSWRWKAV